MKAGIFSLARSAGRYLHARAELLSIEGREAVSLVGKRLISGIIAGCFIGLGYLLILVTAIALGGHYLAQNQEGMLANWMGASLIAAVIHLFLGLIFLSKARQKNKAPLFEYTRAEWEKDQQWIQNQSKNAK